MNSRAGKYRPGNRQQGAAMVEMAIVIFLFLILVFGIIEFALVIYNWSLLNEATRAGARYAIVNDPACDIYGVAGINQYNCIGDALDCVNNPNDKRTVTVTGNCDIETPPGYDLKDGDAGCRIVERMRGIQPLIGLSDPDVVITYACTDAGFAGLTQKVPSVTVGTCDAKTKAELNNEGRDCNLLEYNLIVPGLLGLEVSVNMPGFATTRTGEDLDTVN